ncbi:MAG: hypothetical protein Kow0010_14970 [Dehalococcoidia bacterium]
MGLMLDLQPSLGPALVIGGGAVAARKVRGLAAAGFAMTVVAPAVLEEIRQRPGVCLRERAFEPGDIEGHVLVFACTDDREVNRLAGELARARGIPVVVADSQEESTAFTPAVHREGEMTIAVSTGGRSPAVAAAIRDQLAKELEPEWQARLASSRTRRKPGK